MSVEELLKGLDPDCPNLNDLCGRVEDEVAASGLRGEASLAEEEKRVALLLAEHRQTCERCRAYRPPRTDYRFWPAVIGPVLGGLIGRAAGQPELGLIIGVVVGLLGTAFLLRRSRRG